MIDLSVQLAKAEAEKRADPLASFEWASEGQMLTAFYASKGLETHHRAGGYSGKTWGGAALGLGLARLKPSLAGVELPRFTKPTSGAVLVPTYKQQVESSQKAYLDLLGDHPHHATYVRAGIIDTLFVKPDGWKDDAFETWSRFTFISQDSASPGSVKGQRWDWVHGDEPPNEEYWWEALKNARYLWITETPIKPSEYRWIKERFEGCLNNPSNGRVEVTSTVFDNRYLPQQKKDELVRRYTKTDGLLMQVGKAYLRGEYVDLSGDSPFAMEAQWSRLEELARKAKHGKNEFFTVRTEAGTLRLPVEVWHEPRGDRRYYIPLDSARGLPGSDPACIHVWDRTTKTLCARYGHRTDLPGSGRCAPYTLGALGAALHREYNQALTEPETQGGWGDAVLVALRQHGCSNIGYDHDESRPGHQSKSQGFGTTQVTRPLYLAAIQRDLEEGSFTIESPDAIASLMAFKTDANGRPDEHGARHAEDVILAGRALHVIGRVAKPIPRPGPTWGINEFMREALGGIPVGKNPYLDRNEAW